MQYISSAYQIIIISLQRGYDNSHLCTSHALSYRHKNMTRFQISRENPNSLGPGGGYSFYCLHTFMLP